MLIISNERNKAGEETGRIVRDEGRCLNAFFSYHPTSQRAAKPQHFCSFL